MISSRPLSTTSPTRAWGTPARAASNGGGVLGRHLAEEPGVRLAEQQHGVGRRAAGVDARRGTRSERRAAARARRRRPSRPPPRPARPRSGRGTRGPARRRSPGARRRTSAGPSRRRPVGTWPPASAVDQGEVRAAQLVAVSADQVEQVARLLQVHRHAAARRRRPGPWR